MGGRVDQPLVCLCLSFFPIRGWHGGKDIVFFILFFDMRRTPRSQGRVQLPKPVLTAGHTPGLAPLADPFPCSGGRTVCHHFKDTYCMLIVLGPRLLGLSHSCWDSLGTLCIPHVWW